MPVNTTGQGNISISSINTENTSTTSNSLKTLSETAIEGLSTLNEAPYAMSEFSGYQHFNWGTPTIPSGSNITKIFNMQQERRNSSDTCVVCSFNMNLNTSTKTITVNIVGTDDGGGITPDPAFTINNAITLTYTGVLTSLDGRFVHSGENIIVNNNGDEDGKVLELFSSTNNISNASINNNELVSGTTVTGSNDISSGANGTYKALRTTTGAMAMALAATSDSVSALNDFSQGKIVYTGTDSITLQLRANGSVSVNLFSRQGNFSMESITSLEDTT